MLEELEELGDENVQRSVEGVRVKLLRAVLADLVEGTEGSLKSIYNNIYCLGVTVWDVPLKIHGTKPQSLALSGLVRHTHLTDVCLRVVNELAKGG